jgi:hypothetical protein
MRGVLGRWTLLLHVIEGTGVVDRPGRYAVRLTAVDFGRRTTIQTVSVNVRRPRHK